MQLPEHGVYHPDLGLSAGLADWQKLRQNRPCVGIVFYRAHWISGNLDFVDAMVREFEGRGMDVLPIFTSSLRSLSSSESGEKMAQALEFFLPMAGLSLTCWSTPRPSPWVRLIRER